MDRPHDPVTRFLDWVWLRAMPVFGGWVMRLPKPLRLPVALLTALAMLAIFYALVVLAAFGWLFGYRPR
jgi:hypothetical protein